MVVGRFLRSTYPLIKAPNIAAFKSRENGGIKKTERKKRSWANLEPRHALLCSTGCKCRPKKRNRKQCTLPLHLLRNCPHPRCQPRYLECHIEATSFAPLSQGYLPPSSKTIPSGSPNTRYADGYRDLYRAVC